MILFYIYEPIVTLEILKYCILSCSLPCSTTIMNCVNIFGNIAWNFKNWTFLIVLVKKDLIKGTDDKERSQTLFYDELGNQLGTSPSRRVPRFDRLELMLTRLPFTLRYIFIPPSQLKVPKNSLLHRTLLDLHP